MWSPDSRRVLARAGTGALYVSGPGIHARRLTTHSSGFVWSPDGRLVAYEYFTPKGPKSGTHVTVVDLAGRVVRRVAGQRLPWHVPQPPHLLTSEIASTRVVSPNGSLVARLSAPTASGSTLRISRREGTGTRTVARFPRCTDDGALVTGVAALLFARDGASLVYVTHCSELPADLYELRPDGSGLHRLTNTTADEQSPVWSPDGTRIAYARADDVGLSCKGCPITLWVMNADGTHQRELTQPDPSGGCSFDRSPSWSPDGTEIVFSHSTCDSAGKLFVMPVAGGRPRDLKLAGEHPSWGPTSIAYDAVGGVWTAAPDGSRARRVSPKQVVPSWTADGRLRLVGAEKAVAVRSVRSADWSPDGMQLALVKPSGPETPAGPALDLFTIGVGGRHLARRTTGLGVSPDVSWR